jgi:hypothetical protein
MGARRKVSVKNCDEIIEWWNGWVNRLKKYRIEGDTVVDKNNKPKLKVFVGENNNMNNIAMDFKDLMIKFVKKKDSDKIYVWTDYLKAFRKSPVGQKIYEDIKNNNKGANIFVAVTKYSLKKDTLESHINQADPDLDNVMLSLRLIIMNAIRFYYVHALLAECISNIEEKCANMISILSAVGSNDCSSDYDITLYIHTPDITTVVNCFNKRTLDDWGVPSDKLFDTNIYTSSYLLPINIDVENKKCSSSTDYIGLVNYNMIIDAIKNNEKISKENDIKVCAKFLKINCENDENIKEEQLAFAIIHLLSIFPTDAITNQNKNEKINQVFETTNEIMDGLIKRYAKKKLIDIVDNEIVMITDDIIKNAEDIESSISQLPSLKYDFITKKNTDEEKMKIIVHNIKKYMTDENKKKLYSRYTEELFTNIIHNKCVNGKNIKPEFLGPTACSLLAKINMCLPETYYTYGAFIMNVVLGQMKLIVIHTGLSNSSIVCAILEDYAYILEKYIIYTEGTEAHPGAENHHDAEYVGKCAKYVNRILCCTYMLNCNRLGFKKEKEREICAETVIEKKIGKNTIMKLADLAIGLKILKDNPNDKSAIKKYSEYMEIVISDNDETVNFEIFFKSVQKIIRLIYSDEIDKLKMNGGFYDRYIENKHDYRTMDFMLKW